MADEPRADLVLEGGGAKAVGLVGALSVLEERGYTFPRIAGSSGGALVAALVAAGYGAGDLLDVVLDLDFRSFRDKAWEDRIPRVGALVSVLKDQGVYEGEALERYVRGLLEDRGVRTFGDLSGSDLQVIASDLTGRRLLVLPRDSGLLGLRSPEDLDVALAVRMSASLPFFFEPVRFPNPETGEEHLVLDGGILSNFPVWLFDTEDRPRWPTFGLLLVEPEPRASIADRLGPAGAVGGATIRYVEALIMTLLEARDRLYVEQADFARTIPIPTLGVRTTDFDLSRARRLELYEAGRAAAERFLGTWSFDGYVAAFRGEAEHSRRREVAERMRRAAEGLRPDEMERLR